MDYITAEQFLEQPEEIQDILKDWWIKNKQAYDIYFEPKIDFETNKVILKDTVKWTDYYNVPINQIRCIGCYPAFTEGQLRKFIDEKTGGIVAIKYLSDKVWWIKADDTYRTESDDLLQAYWQVACQIAKGDD